MYLCTVIQKWRYNEVDLVAQLVEHLTFNQRVPGSSPGPITINACTLNVCRRFLFSFFLQKISPPVLKQVAIFFINITFFLRENTQHGVVSTYFFQRYYKSRSTHTWNFGLQFPLLHDRIIRANHGIFKT